MEIYTAKGVNAQSVDGGHLSKNNTTDGLTKFYMNRYDLKPESYLVLLDNLKIIAIREVNQSSLQYNCV